MIHNLCFSDGLKHHIICSWPFLLWFLVAFRNFAELKLIEIHLYLLFLYSAWKGTHLTEACRDSHNWQLALGHSAVKTQGKWCFSVSQNSSLQIFCWKCYILVGNKKKLRPLSQVEMHNSSLEKESHFPKQGVKLSCWFSWPFTWHLQWHHQTAILKSSQFFVLFLNHGGPLECLLSDSKSGLLFDALDTPSPFDKGGGGWPNMSISSKPPWWNHHVSELAQSLDPKKWWWFQPRYATKFRGVFPHSKEQERREFPPPKPLKKYLQYVQIHTYIQIHIYIHRIIHTYIS